jgi:hypothetical protein
MRVRGSSIAPGPALLPVPWVPALPTRASSEGTLPSRREGPAPTPLEVKGGYARIIDPARSPRSASGKVADPWPTTTSHASPPDSPARGWPRERPPPAAGQARSLDRGLGAQRLVPPAATAARRGDHPRSLGQAGQGSVGGLGSGAPLLRRGVGGKPPLPPPTLIGGTIRAGAGARGGRTGRPARIDGAPALHECPRASGRRSIRETP